MLYSMEDSKEWKRVLGPAILCTSERLDSFVLSSIGFIYAPRSWFPWPKVVLARPTCANSDGLSSSTSDSGSGIRWGQVSDTYCVNEISERPSSTRSDPIPREEYSEIEPREPVESTRAEIEDEVWSSSNALVICSDWEGSDDRVSRCESADRT